VVVVTVVVVTVVVGIGVVVVTDAVDVTATVVVTAAVADAEVDRVVVGAPDGRGVVVDAVAALAEGGPLGARVAIVVGTATEAVMTSDGSTGVRPIPLIKIGESIATSAVDRPLRSLVASAI